MCLHMAGEIKTKSWALGNQSSCVRKDGGPRKQALVWLSRVVVPHVLGDRQGGRSGVDSSSCLSADASIRAAVRPLSARTLPEESAGADGKPHGSASPMLLFSQLPTALGL